MSKVAILATVLFGLCLQDVDNPVYKNWAKFKAGTKVTLKMESEMSGMKSEMEITTELKSVDEKEVVLSAKTTMLAPNKMDLPAQEQKHPAKVKKTEGQPSDKKPEEGDEEVEVAGKKYKCHWVKTTTEQGWSKVWSSDDVPGQMVKMESEMSGSKSKMWVTAIETK